MASHLGLRNRKEKPRRKNRPLWFNWTENIWKVQPGTPDAEISCKPEARLALCLSLKVKGSTWVDLFAWFPAIRLFSFQFFRFVRVSMYRDHWIVKRVPPRLG